VSLSDLYAADYLRARGGPSASRMADALRESLPFEALLLDRFAERGEGTLAIEDGPWRGRPIWLGPQLPPVPQAGQLWFDTVELTAMVLLPREPPEADWHPDAVARWTPFVGWLATRPVTVWQYRAFLALVRFVSGEADATSFKGHDPVRILDDDPDTAPVTRLTAAEAKDFAMWMGKQLPSQDMWQIARGLMPNAIDVLWGQPRKEWIGYPEPEDDEATAIAPSTIDCDSWEERDFDDVPPPERRMLYRYRDWSKNFGFRTAIFDGVGLLNDPSTGLLYRR
jgi:hypothetical protein